MVTSADAQANKPKPQPLNKTPAPSNTTKDSQVVVKVRRVEFDIYFDGTWNSKFNSNWYNDSNWYQSDTYVLDGKTYDHNPATPLEQEAREVFKADQTSFARAPTGVDQMHRAAKTDDPYIIPLYADGSGTTTPSDNPYLLDDVNDYRPSSPGAMQNDTKAGSGIGMGATGVHAKMERMFEHVQDRLDKLKANTKEPIGIVMFNVYGFSRGATTARMFVYRIIKERNERAIKKRLDLTGYTVMVKFVGLFDTVSSVGPFNHNNDVEKDKLGTGFDPKDITGKIVHLVAGHEFRQKYSVTNIKQAVSAGYGFEIVLPGNHTDIGDGKSTEKSYDLTAKTWDFIGNEDVKTILQHDVSLVSADWLLAPAALFSKTVRDQFGTKSDMNKSNLNNTMAILVNQGWFKPEKKQIWIDKQSNREFHQLRVERTLTSLDYPKVPTWIMIGLTKEVGADHLEESLIVKYKITTAQNKDLEKIYEDLEKQVKAKWQQNSKGYASGMIINNEPLKSSYVTVTNETLRKIMFNEYLQWSSSVEQDAKGVFVTVNLPRINSETNQFYREVIDG